MGRHKEESLLLDVILIKEFNGSSYGDILSVNNGLYNSLINLKIGMAVNDFEDAKGNQKIVNTAKNNAEDLEHLTNEYYELENKNIKMSQVIEDMKKKIKRLEECKDKRTKNYKNYSNKMMETQNYNKK